MYINTYVYIYIYIYLNIYIYIYIYFYMCWFTFICTCIYTFPPLAIQKRTAARGAAAPPSTQLIKTVTAERATRHLLKGWSGWGGRDWERECVRVSMGGCVERHLLSWRIFSSLNSWVAHQMTRSWVHLSISHDLNVRMHNLNTGWRRLIGPPKLQIIFHKRATKYRSLLQKMTYEDKGSYESSPPCMRMHYLNVTMHNLNARISPDLNVRMSRGLE